MSCWIRATPCDDVFADSADRSARSTPTLRVSGYKSRDAIDAVGAPSAVFSANASGPAKSRIRGTRCLAPLCIERKFGKTAVVASVRIYGRPHS